MLAAVVSSKSACGRGSSEWAEGGGFQLWSQPNQCFEYAPAKHTSDGVLILAHAGRPKDFADTDKVFAESVPLNFFVPEDFFIETNPISAARGAAAAAATPASEAEVVELSDSEDEQRGAASEAMPAATHTPAVASIPASPERIDLVDSDRENTPSKP